MMKRKPENRNPVVRQMSVVPLMAVLIFALSNRGDELVFSAPGKESVTLATDSKELQVRLKPAGKSDDAAGIIAVKTENSDGPERKNSGDEIRKGITIRSTSGDSSQPLYLVDGEKVENLDNLIPDDIESIDVLKGNTATGRYGDDGKNGVVIVQMKAGKTAAKKAVKGNPLVILDGKEYSGNMDDIPPGDISSVSVLKDSSLTKLYGEKARDGVILISTKTKYNSDVSETVVDGHPLPGEISTIDDFRKFIAGKIKYPALAQQNDIQGLAELWFVVEGDGRITWFYETPPKGNVAGVDEIVVVAYGMKKSTTSGQKKSGDEVVVVGYASAGSGKLPDDPVSLLRDEVRRVVLSVDTLGIPELKGKTVAVKVRFVLQK